MSVNTRSRSGTPGFARQVGQNEALASDWLNLDGPPLQPVVNGAIWGGSSHPFRPRPRLELERTCFHCGTPNRIPALYCGVCGQLIGPHGMPALLREDPKPSSQDGENRQGATPVHESKRGRNRTSQAEPLAEEVQLPLRKFPITVSVAAAPLPLSPVSARPVGSPGSRRPPQGSPAGSPLEAPPVKHRSGRRQRMPRKTHARVPGNWHNSGMILVFLLLGTLFLLSARTWNQKSLLWASRQQVSAAVPIPGTYSRFADIPLDHPVYQAWKPLIDCGVPVTDENGAVEPGQSVSWRDWRMAVSLLLARVPMRPGAMDPLLGESTGAMSGKDLSDSLKIMQEGWGLGDSALWLQFTRQPTRMEAFSALSNLIRGLQL